MTPEQQAQMDEALAMIKAVFEDGEAEINGRRYKFLRMTHKQRRKVFAFFSKIMRDVQRGNMSFVDSPEFEPVEEIIHGVVTLDDSLLSKLGDAHWEKYPGDYLSFTTVAIQVISYPFMVDAPTA